MSIFAPMKFSVIMPLYNKAPYVAKAIASVLSQTCSDFEFVIMDDGSSDDSFEIARQAIKGRGNSYIHRQQNAGVSTARNNAAALCHGDYLCFLDADDWWEPAFLEEMAKLIADFPEAGIYGTNYTIVNETRHRTRVASVGVEPGFERGYINFCRVYSVRMYMPLWTGAVCIPSGIFKEMCGFKPYLKLGEDFDLWIRIALKYKVAFLNKPLSNYCQDSSPQWRAVGRLQDPGAHMLWNLGYLEDEERTNPDLKQLIDNLRTFDLLPYYLSRRYREVSRRELDKVDWDRQPKKTKDLYHKPVICLKLRQLLRSIGSMVKQMVLRVI